MPRLSLRSIVIAGALIAAPLTAALAQVDWLRRMVGSADDNARMNLSRMGFRQVDSFASGYNGRGGVWYNGSTGQCIQVITANQRVDSAMDIGSHPRCRDGRNAYGQRNYGNAYPNYGNGYPNYGNGYPSYGNAYPNSGNNYPNYGNGYNAPVYGGGNIGWLNGLIGKGFNRAEEQLRRNGFRSVDSFSISPNSYATIWFNGSQCLQLTTITGRLGGAVDIGRHPRCR